MKERSTGWEWGTSLNQGHQRRVPGGDEPEPHFINLLQVDRSGKGKAIAAQRSSCVKTQRCAESVDYSGSHIKFKGTAGNRGWRGRHDEIGETCVKHSKGFRL